jgi:putative ribosome biogenesis GTPase RsgA
MESINIGNTKEISLNKKKDNNDVSDTNNLNELTNEEKLKAKENGFILLGKTGVGKTSILNLIYKKQI